LTAGAGAGAGSGAGAGASCLNQSHRTNVSQDVYNHGHSMNESIAYWKELNLLNSENIICQRITSQVYNLKTYFEIN